MPLATCRTHGKGIKKAKMYFHCGCWEYQIGAVCAMCRDVFVLRTKKTPFRRTFCSVRCKNKFHSRSPKMRAYKAAWEKEHKRTIRTIKESSGDGKQ